ncbi:MAG: helix-turn-helix transcriptional regulator [Bacteroidota bacterium]
MEDNKPTYEEVENELNEYKELLWQLSDEYKENVTAAEKKMEAEIDKRLLLESKLADKKTEAGDSNISALGLPACILDKDGKIVRFNNKFKFLIELLFSEIEEISNIQELLEKNKTNGLLNSFLEYLEGDKSLFQSLYTVENLFQGEINLILRIYRNENHQEHLALFVELHKQELDSLKKEKTDEVIPPVEEKKEAPVVPPTIEKTQSPVITASTEKENILLMDIKSFVKRSEVSTQLLNFINKKINDKTENISLIREIYTKVEKVFSLKKEAKDLLKKLDTEHKEFLVRLKKEHSSLTANEIKQCLLIRTNLTYKEIAALMEISVNGVKIARNRLRKKLELDADTKTIDFIMGI